MILNVRIITAFDTYLAHILIDLPSSANISFLAARLIDRWLGKRGVDGGVSAVVKSLGRLAGPNKKNGCTFPLEFVPKLSISMWMVSVGPSILTQLMSVPLIRRVRVLH